MNDEIKFDLDKDIIMQIEMASYAEYNDTLAMMNDHLGEVYGYSNLKDVEEAQLHYEKELAYKAIKELQQENEDNLKCIKSLKEQLESVIKNNQELLEKWHKNNDKIVNLISENERLKENNQDMQEEMARTWEENERLKEDLKGQGNLTLSYCKSEQDYKSRLEKAIEYICRKDMEANLKGNAEFKSKDLINILQNGDDSE